jgi:hypothetical protein
MYLAGLQSFEVAYEMYGDTQTTNSNEQSPCSEASSHSASRINGEGKVVPVLF